VTLAPVFQKFLTPGTDPGLKEKRRILPESTPALRIHDYLWVKAVDGRPKAAFRFLPGRVEVNAFAQEHYVGSLSGGGSRTPPFNFS